MWWQSKWRCGIVIFDWLYPIQQDQALYILFWRVMNANNKKRTGSTDNNKVKRLQPLVMNFINIIYYLFVFNNFMKRYSFEYRVPFSTISSLPPHFLAFSLASWKRSRQEVVANSALSGKRTIHAWLPLFSVTLCTQWFRRDEDLKCKIEPRGNWFRRILP